MTHLTLQLEEHPNVIPDDAKVGDRIDLSATGWIRRIEGDPIETLKRTP